MRDLSWREKMAISPRIPSAFSLQCSPPHLLPTSPPICLPAAATLVPITSGINPDRLAKSLFNFQEPASSIRRVGSSSPSLWRGWHCGEDSSVIILNTFSIVRSFNLCSSGIEKSWVLKRPLCHKRAIFHPPLRRIISIFPQHLQAYHLQERVLHKSGGPAWHP